MNLVLVADPSALPPLAGEFARSPVALPPVDWSQEAVLIVDMGEQRTAGFGVSVLDVSRNGAGEVELKLDVRRPAAGTFVAQVITHPHAAARVPRAWLNRATVVARDQHGKELIRQEVSL